MPFKRKLKFLNFKHNSWPKFLESKRFQPKNKLSDALKSNKITLRGKHIKIFFETIQANKYQMHFFIDNAMQINFIQNLIYILFLLLPLLNYIPIQNTLQIKRKISVVFMTNLYVCKGGKLIPRDPQKATYTKPTIITYKHLITQINDRQCKCKEEKERLKKEYQTQLNEKNEQILALINRIGQKQSEIDKLQHELLCLRNIQSTLEVKSEPNLQIQGSFWDRMDKTLNSTVVSSFSICDFNLTERSKKNQVIEKTEKQIDSCFRKTNTLMSQIEGIMKKKRKYEFYNPIEVENSIIEELQNSEEKSLEDNQQIVMEDTFLLPRSEYNDYDSLDMTNFESVQNFGDQDHNEETFYGKLLKDSIQLKNHILQMRQQHLQEVSQIEAYYQKQLRISFEELTKERQKNQLHQTTKSKLGQISEKGRKALAQLDQNEELSFDLKEKRKSFPHHRIKEQVQNLLT